LDKNHPLSIRQQCELLEINRSSVYYQAQELSEFQERLINLVDMTYTQYPFFGTRQMSSYLQRFGEEIGREHVRSIYKHLGLYAVAPGPLTSKGHPQHKVYPYLLRNVEIVRPNQVWSSDITYVRLRRGFVYLSVIMDWFSRYVLDWSVSITMDAEFCIELLSKSLSRGICEFFNSDQGSQYTSEGFTSLLKSRGIKISMNGKGRCHDNIFNERLWRSVKTEKVYLSDWDNPGDCRLGLAEYFSFYNNSRPHQSLCNRTPAEVYEERVAVPVN